MLQQITKYPNGIKLGRVLKISHKTTIKVGVEKVMWHPIAMKPVIRQDTFQVHDPQSQCVVGDVVNIEEKSISKTKKHILKEIMTPAKRYLDPSTGILHTQGPDAPRRNRLLDYGVNIY